MTDPRADTQADHTCDQSSLPESGRTCASCGGSWLAIGLIPALSRTCPFCAHNPYDRKESK